MNLTELREGRGWSKRELAEKLHISPSLISMVENGKLKSWPKLDKKLKRIFGNAITQESE